MKEAMRLIDLWRIIGSHKLLMAAGTLSVVGLVFVTTLFSTPMYQASVVLSPADNSTEGAGLSRLANQLGGLTSNAGSAGVNGNDAGPVVVAHVHNGFCGEPESSADSICGPLERG